MRRIILCFERAIPSVMSLLHVMIFTIYIYAVIGVQAFGGVINTDPGSSYYAALKGSNFAEANYWANNFNDVPSGMVVLYELLVINTSGVITDGFTLTCGKWARVYFIGFWYIGVLICL